MIAGSGHKNPNLGVFLDTFLRHFTSVHVPQLVCAVDDKALTVKILGSIIWVELGVLPEAAVVVSSGRQLICYKCFTQSGCC